MLSIARLILAYNPLTTVCVALYPPPEVGGFTATGDK